MSEIRAGVIGVGSMGRHHARVYRELPNVELFAVADQDTERAEAVAEDYDARVLSTEGVLTAVDAVSVTVPTEYHYAVAKDAMDRGTHVLVEKPFVEDPEAGRDLIETARAAGLTLQVGHVERFNPAVRTLQDIVPDLDVLAVDARRLGPPVDREIGDSAVLDLMIHDIDVVLSLVDDDLSTVEAFRSPDDPYVTASLQFDGGVVGTLTASRVTQERVRQLSITARECQVNVDYMKQTVGIHRHSLPEYVERDGDVRYRNETVIERPTVDNGEPLKKELAAFAESVETGGEPVVTGEDGLRALSIANRIDGTAADRVERQQEVRQA
ncbi:Gfo/Idh/MocA family protein [Halostella salina]|uniref:Gfo/Idh/MocA family protein n=1 Tax=Halostella salina TaxID=1547897 RepID=UPI000EF7E891|nr:Gfo/Idh/MocA family oxidoreductase [Halostella salina]